MGDVIGDLNKRRGQVEGMETSRTGARIVKALFRSVLECLDSCDFERQLVRVNRVERTIDQSNFQLCVLSLQVVQLLQCSSRTMLKYLLLSLSRY